MSGAIIPLPFATPQRDSERSEAMCKLIFDTFDIRPDEWRKPTARSKRKFISDLEELTSLALARRAGREVKP